MRRESTRAWTIPVPANRGTGRSRHVHDVQIAGIEQRIRHKASMVNWLEMLSLIATIGAGLGFMGCAAGMGAVFMSFRAQEPTLTGFLVFVLTLAIALCCLLTRFLVNNAKRALARDVLEAVQERNRLQYVR
jgi:hypothetical protein